MNLKIALQMDELEGINPETDTTYILGLEAQRRGHTLFHYLPENLSLKEGQPIARGHDLIFHENKTAYYTRGEEKTIRLEEFDLILMRQDPPFDMAYITATHILEHLEEKTLVLNNPVSVRNAPEKLLVTHFPDLIPPTLISSDLDEIMIFHKKHKNIIIKPLYHFGGKDVFLLTPKSKNLKSTLSQLQKCYKEQLVIQKFIPEIAQGDKRVMILNGNIIGNYLRIPPEGQIIANSNVGGTQIKSKITKRDQEICDAIKPELIKRGLIFVSIDIIGEYLTEINITCPSGVQYLNKLSKTRLETCVWDAFEARYKDFKNG